MDTIRSVLGYGPRGKEQEEVTMVHKFIILATIIFF